MLAGASRQVGLVRIVGMVPTGQAHAQLQVSSSAGTAALDGDEGGAIDQCTGDMDNGIEIA